MQKFFVTKRHLSGLLQGITTREVTTVDFSQHVGKVLRAAVTGSRYEVQLCRPVREEEGAAEISTEGAQSVVDPVYAPYGV